MRRVLLSCFLLLSAGIVLHCQDMDGRTGPAPVATIKLRGLRGTIDLVGGLRTLWDCGGVINRDSALQTVGAIDTRIEINATAVQLHRRLLDGDTSVIVASVRRTDGEYSFSDQSLSFVVDTARRVLAWLCFEHSVASAVRNSWNRAELHQTTCDFKLTDIPYIYSGDGEIVVELRGEEIDAHLATIHYDDRYSRYRSMHEYHAERLLGLIAQDAGASIAITIRR